jgi:hypothetical protein
MAQKRAAKANRRKAVVAGKRKTELVDSSFAVQIARAVQCWRSILAGDGSMTATLIVN